MPLDAIARSLPRDASAAARIYLRPLTTTQRDARPGSPKLAGGAMCFDAVELIVKAAEGGLRRQTASLEEIEARAGGDEGFALAVRSWLDRLRRRPEPLLGLDFTRPLLMGVVNLTADSFSDGGDHLATEAAVDRAHALVDAGADLIDLGAESTRPGAAEVPSRNQLARLLPVLQRLSALEAPISVDTRSAVVMREVLAAGASLINDVSGLRHDPAAAAVIAEAKAPVVLMHSRATPATMQAEARYDDVLTEVYDALDLRIGELSAAGIAGDRLIVDPGFGFAKTAAHNVALLTGLALLHGLGRPLLAGLSRKSYIARLSRGEAPKARLPGSLAAALWALGQGAQMLRVHDVLETAQAVALWRKLAAAPEGA